MFISGGNSQGLSPTLDKGGSVHIVGGYTAESNGGTMQFMSGMSGAGSSGEVLIVTSDDGINGINSGNISLGNGFSVDRISSII